MYTCKLRWLVYELFSSYFNVYPPLLIMLFLPGFSLAEGSVQSAAISHIASGIFIASQNYSQEIFVRGGIRTHVNKHGLSTISAR